MAVSIAAPAAAQQAASAGAASDFAPQAITLGVGLILGALIVFAAALASLAMARRRILAPAAPTAALLLLAAAFYEAAWFGLAPVAAAGEGGVLAIARGGLAAAAFAHLGLALGISRNAIWRRGLFAIAAALALIGVGAAFRPENLEWALRGATAGAALLGLIIVVFEAIRGDWNAKMMVPGAVLLIAGVLFIRAPELIGFAGALADFAPHVVFALGAIAIAFAVLAATQADSVAQSDPAPSLASTPPSSSAPSPAYAALRKSDADFLSGAGLGLWKWDARTDRTTASPDLRAAIGLDPDDASPEPEAFWRARIAPEDLFTYDQAILGGEQPQPGAFDVTLRLATETGRLEPFRFRGVRRVGKGGALAGADAVVDPVMAHDINAPAPREGEGRNAVDAGSDRDEPLAARQREWFLRRAREALQEAAAEDFDSGRIGVLVIRLADGSLVESVYGAKAGDGFVETIARRLEAADCDFAALSRLGGEKLAALFRLRNTTAEDALYEIARRIEATANVNGEKVSSAAWIGAAMMDGRDAELALVHANAEIAAAEAQRSGVTGGLVYHAGLRRDAERRLSLHGDLRDALSRGEFETHYQPVIRLKDGAPAGFEALLRWRRGAEFLSPDEFVKAAEESGLIRDIGRAVLNDAAQDLKRWRDATGNDNLFVSVNISSCQVLKPGLETAFLEAVSKAGLPSGALKLEITESQLMQDPDAAAEVMDRLRDAGAGLAIDDFGTGFSSLSRLHRFNFDMVKIDRSFISEMGRGSAASIIAESVIRLAKDLNMRIVAEGVESEDTARRLKTLGCDFAQGFVYGGAISADDAAEFLRIYDAKRSPGAEIPEFESA
ncbi:MAG: hypothetical protein Tsb0010_00620 [Parvularculaceae bacterium]